MAGKRAYLCPYNIGLKCLSEKLPLSRDSAGVWECLQGNCSYVVELNAKEESVLHLLDVKEGIADLRKEIAAKADLIHKEIAELRTDIGAKEEGGPTVISSMEDIRQQLEWIRQNIGAAEDGDPTIADKLDDLYEAIQNLEITTDNGGQIEDSQGYDQGSHAAVVRLLEEIKEKIDDVKEAVNDAANDIVHSL